MFLSGLLLVLTAGNMAGQESEKSPSDVITLLGQPTLQDQMGLNPCSSARKYRPEAVSLAKLGASAIPDIERAIDSIEEHGEESPFAINARWLILPYAQILGRAAYPRLRGFMDNPKLKFLRSSLDGALGLSLGLTSFVSDFNVPARVIHCDRRGEPRDALDGLILAWERNDRQWLEANLGPSAKIALNSLLNGKTWAELRADLWPGKSNGGVAVGYRFEVSGAWSEPEDTLAEKQEQGGGALTQLNLEIETVFKDHSGGDCGRRSVKFVQLVPAGAPGEKYLVDNSDIGDLLRSISRCAREASK